MLSLEKILEIAEACGVEVSNEHDGNHYILDPYGNKQVFFTSSIPFISFDSFNMNVNIPFFAYNSSFNNYLFNESIYTSKIASKISTTLHNFSSTESTTQNNVFIYAA